MPVDPTCDTLDQLLGNIGACWPDARGPIVSALTAIYNFLNCGQNGCGEGCIKDVGTGVDPSAFIAKGWPDGKPDIYTCPILWVITGCDVWVGVNKPDCDLASGAGWCKLCGAQSGAPITAQLRTNPGTVLPILNAYINRPISATEWNDGIGISLINSAPAGGMLGANAFTLLIPGTYLLDWRLSTLATQSDSPTNLRNLAQIYDLTNAVVLKDLQSAEISGNAPGIASFIHFGRVKVTVALPRTFSIRMNGNPGVGITSNSCQGDEVFITKIA